MVDQSAARDHVDFVAQRHHEAQIAFDQQDRDAAPRQLSEDLRLTSSPSLLIHAGDGLVEQQHRGLHSASARMISTRRW